MLRCLIANSFLCKNSFKVSTPKHDLKANLMKKHCTEWNVEPIILSQPKSCYFYLNNESNKFYVMRGRILWVTKALQFNFNPSFLLANFNFLIKDFVNWVKLNFLFLLHITKRLKRFIIFNLLCKNEWQLNDEKLRRRKLEWKNHRAKTFITVQQYAFNNSLCFLYVCICFQKNIIML